LISGIGAVAKDQAADSTLIGCQPANSPEMCKSVRAGAYREVESKRTLSYPSAAGFEAESVTLDLCQELVDDFILMSEDEIKAALRSMVKYHHKIIEGAAGVTIASLLKDPKRFTGQTSVIVVCGANISIDKLRDIL